MRSEGAVAAGPAPRDGGIELGRIYEGRVPAVLLGHLNLVRALGLGGVPVVVATEDPRDFVVRSRYVHGRCVVPGFAAAVEHVTLARLLRLGEQLGARFGARIPLFYGNDDALDFVQRHRRALEARFAFLANPDGLAAALADKQRFYELCRRCGVLAPRTLPADRLSPETAAGLEGPVVLKPRTKTAWYELREQLFGGRAKARIYYDPAQLLDDPVVARHRARLLVQEYVPGDDAQICSFHAFADEHSRVLAAFTGHKLRTYPALTGESSFIELCVDPAVDGAGKDIVARLGCRGPLKIDFKRHARTGQLYALEINARCTLWEYLGAMAGANLMRVAYDHLLGRAPPQAAWHPGYRWLDFYLDWHAYRELHQRGQLGLSEWLGSLWGRNVYAAFSWRDPAPFAFWVGDFLYRKVQRRASRGAP